METKKQNQPEFATMNIETKFEEFKEKVEEIIKIDYKL